MRDVTTHNFGLLIAYLLPGLTALWGASHFSETIRAWLGHPPTPAPTVGGFLYVTIGAVMAGLIVSTVRWLIVDRIHHWTGVRRPDFDYARLQQNIGAFELLVRHHYMYYKSNANILVSVLFAYLAHRISTGFWTTPIRGIDIACLLLALLLFLASRDNLRNYYRRVEMSLGSRTIESVNSQNFPDCSTSGTKDGDEELTKPADSLH